MRTPHHCIEELLHLSWQNGRSRSLGMSEDASMRQDPVHRLCKQCAPNSQFKARRQVHSQGGQSSQKNAMGMTVQARFNAKQGTDRLGSYKIDVPCCKAANTQCVMRTFCGSSATPIRTSPEYDSPTILVRNSCAAPFKRSGVLPAGRMSLGVARRQQALSMALL